jgi:hypothetical protein
MNLPVAIHLTPERIMDRFDNPHIVRIGSLASLRLTRPALSAVEILAKRVFDIVAASMILVLTLPLLLVIAALIRLDSPGPVLFLQRRYGFNQQPFRIFKFPHHDDDRRWRHHPPGDARRPAHHPHRPHPAPLQSRRAAAIAERGRRPDVAGRAAPACAGP